MNVRVDRASREKFEPAWAMVQEYYEAASVVVREDRKEFEEQYFSLGAGFWLAETEREVMGCVGLRELRSMARSGEVKRMYVRPPYRGQGIANLLFRKLEDYARKSNYQWLYLDTAGEMKAAARFYLREGFLECARYNENPQAALFLRKALC